MKNLSSKKTLAFTLMELLITLILLFILTGTVVFVYLGGMKAVDSEFDRSDIQGEAGRALWQMSQELRQAASLSKARVKQLIFNLDADDDGVEETVRYYWAGSSGDPLERTQSAPEPAFTIAVIPSVQSLSFTYARAPGEPATFPVPPDEVQIVTIDVTALEGKETFHLRTNVELRLR